METMPKIFKIARDIQDYMERKLTAAITVEYEDNRVLYKSLLTSKSFASDIAGYIQDFFENKLRKSIRKKYYTVLIDNEDLETLYTLLRLEGEI